jgi:hypothetical protein
MSTEKLAILLVSTFELYQSAEKKEKEMRNQQKNKDSNNEEGNIMNQYQTILFVLKNIVM